MMIIIIGEPAPLSALRTVLDACAHHEAHCYCTILELINKVYKPTAD